MLTRSQYQSIKRWIYRNARPIDLARWQYHFEDGSAKAVVNALEAYQNPDGGFGHALEADCWNPASAPLQTWWATQFLNEIGMIDSEHPIVQNILAYLDSEDGMAQGRWQFSIPSNNQHPRAPWWTYSEADEAPGYNPTAALAGYIVTHAAEGSRLFDKGLGLAKESLDIYMARKVLTEMHELACFIELYEDMILLGRRDLIDLESVKHKLKADVYETIEQDSDRWMTEYCCKPSHLFRSPKSIFYENNKKIVDAELQFIIKSLSEEGTWSVPWAWGSYEENFAVSRRWWQANIAIQNLRMLKAFGQIEPI